MAVYPSTLPGLQAIGHTVKPSDTTVRTDMEIGAPRARRISAARNDRIQGNWLFSDPQLEQFRDWFDSPAGANGGAAWFTGLRVAIGNGGVRGEECRIVGAFQAANHGGLVWTVTAELEVR